MVRSVVTGEFYLLALKDDVALEARVRMSLLANTSPLFSPTVWEAKGLTLRSDGCWEAEELTRVPYGWWGAAHSWC